MPYVEARTESIIAQKESQHVIQELATEPEIVAAIRSDVLECMRELHRTDKYDAVNTLNHPALKKKEND